MNYLIHLLILFEIYAVLALGANVVVGYCGLLTLSHAGFVGIGAYIVALLTKVYDWGYLPSVAVAVLTASTASLVVSLPARRLGGDSFVLVTLAIQALIFSILYNWSEYGEPLGSWANMTNGAQGIGQIPRPRVLSWSIDAPIEFAVLSTAVAALSLGVAWRLLSSPWGRLLQCMRDDEAALRALGKDTNLLKVQAFALSCALAAVSGALYAGHFRHIQPTAFALDASILTLTMVSIGGVGNLRGPLVGSLVVVSLPEALRFLALPDAYAANLRLLIYGGLLVLFMHLRPQGIAGRYRLD